MKYMIFHLTVVLTILLLPVKAYALPTPDVFVSIVNIIPLLTGTVIAITGGAYYGISKRLGPHASKLFLGGLFGFLTLMISLGYLWHQNRQEKRLANIAMYLRCDLASHEAARKLYHPNNRNSLALWREYGNFKLIPIKKVPDKLRQQPSATLIASSSRTIKYHSGVPAVKVDGHLYPFSYIRSLELPDALKSNNSKDLYMTDFPYIARLPSYYKPDKSFFKKFENIYIVKDVENIDRYVIGKNGFFRPADPKNKIINWPVEKEKWILDEKRIYFPGIVNFLADDKVADLFDQKDVYLVAPYNSFRRSTSTYERYYLRRLLSKIDPNRIISIDMNLPTTSQKLEEAAKKLDGARFVAIGLSKTDWLYDGLDAIFEIWEHLDHDTERFRLLGFNTRLPEVVAIRWESGTRKGVIDTLREPFWDLVRWFKRQLGHSTGAAIFFLAVTLRLLFFPVGICEACSRIKRATIKNMLKNENKPLWSSASPVLLRHLKVSSGWEFLGTIVMLILVLPAYKLLSFPPEDFQNISFLWIDNLTQPDYLLSVLAGGLIYYKMSLGTTSAKPITMFAVTFAFVLLLIYLPGSLLVYVSGVLAVTIIQDIIALKRAEKTINRALLTSA
jgi:membrane protein insertase Oxa1/YidC/SpoIIIJ